MKLGTEEVVWYDSSCFLRQQAIRVTIPASMYEFTEFLQSKVARIMCFRGSPSDLRGLVVASMS